MTVTETTSRTRLQCRGDCSHFRNARDISIHVECLVREVSVFKIYKKKYIYINKLPFVSKISPWPSPTASFSSDSSSAVCVVAVAGSGLHRNALRTVFNLVSVLL